VNFEGKTTLTVERNFTLGNQNDWPNVFPEFATKIGEHIGNDTKNLLECNFSNTSPMDKVVSNIVLMDAMQEYFDYEMDCGCGIPYIELSGTFEDWKLIRKKAEQLLEFKTEKDPDLGEWMKELLPVLDHFVLAASGTPDKIFWASVCNLDGGSGMKGDPITGWIQTFFPYLESGEKNSGFSQWQNAYNEMKLKGIEKMMKEAQTDEEGNNGYGIALDQFPSGISSAPFKFNDLRTDKSSNLRFCGGLVSMHQDSNGVLEVKTGYAIVYDNPENQTKKPPKEEYDD